MQDCSPGCLVDAGFWRFCRSGAGGSVWGGRKWFLVGGGVEAGGWNYLGRVEVSGEGGTVRGVLLTRGFAGRIVLLVQNRPPDTT